MFVSLQTRCGHECVFGEGCNARKSKKCGGALNATKIQQPQEVRPNNVNLHWSAIITKEQRPFDCKVVPNRDRPTSSANTIYQERKKKDRSRILSRLFVSHISFVRCLNVLIIKPSSSRQECFEHGNSQNSSFERERRLSRDP